LAENTTVSDQNAKPVVGKAERDFVALGIATAAIILFVGTGGSIFPEIMRSALYGEAPPDALLANALILNIALIVFGWRRYRELQQEIEIRQEAEAKARELAEIDPLTGCLNRRAMTSMADTLRRDANARGEAVAYVMIDIDSFKQINDMHGHTVGDAVLIEVTNRIRQFLVKNVCFARLGGDEFALAIAYDPAYPERIDDQVIRLYEVFTNPIETGSGQLKVTMSVGIATDYDKYGFDVLVKDSSALMHKADIAMYHAKKSGKNRFFWFDPSMEHELRFRNELEAGIRNSLAEKQFIPYYEQQIDIESGMIVGFEMLARWKSPNMGIVSPEIFIPIAEEMGVIGDLSEQLIERAFQDALEWDASITLSINVSPVQLRDPWFAQKLLKQLVKSNFPPRRLDVEITESCLHENIGLVRSMITSLQNQGVRISLDDFGTGYSSLEQLRTLPFDRLKIDRSFISELSKPEGHSRIVDAIISLGRGLDLPITCEGIEDEQILGALKKMGNLKGQGYLYGQPETAEEVRSRLAEAGLLNEADPKEVSVDESVEVALEAATETAQRRDPHNFLRRARG